MRIKHELWYGQIIRDERGVKLFGSAKKHLEGEQRQVYERAMRGEGKTA